ncbi:MAG TPA: antibiotic biosynthesis monooxygenase family protein [Candidatus Limnocylindrales bacterium]|nr:antibiotic biosynthesis monooxygenase family protein [Candidatus Limnocylindrales bacterium]
MSVMSLLTVTSRPGQGDELEARLQRGLQVHAEDPECLAIYLRRSIERPDEFLIQTFWSSIAAHHAWRDANRSRWHDAVGWEIVEQGPSGTLAYGHYLPAATVKGDDPSLNG